MWYTLDNQGHKKDSHGHNVAHTRQSRPRIRQSRPDSDLRAVREQVRDDLGMPVLCREAEGVCHILALTVLCGFDCLICGLDCLMCGLDCLGCGLNCLGSVLDCLMCGGHDLRAVREQVRNNFRVTVLRREVQGGGAVSRRGFGRRACNGVCGLDEDARTHTLSLSHTLSFALTHTLSRCGVQGVGFRAWVSECGVRGVGFACGEEGCHARAVPVLRRAVHPNSYIRIGHP